MKNIVLFLTCFINASIFAQVSTKFTYIVSLSSQDTIDTGLYLHSNPCADFETKLGSEVGKELKNELLPLCSHEDLKKIMDSDMEYYRRCLKNNTFYNTTASAEKQRIDSQIADYVGLQSEFGSMIMECVNNNIQNGYKDNFSFFSWNSYKYYSLFHSKIVEKSFRDVIYNKVVDVLCKMVGFYPQDYRSKLVREFSLSLKAIDEAQKHKYEVKEDETKSWKPLCFFIDGAADYEKGYGLTGFLLRRIYMDNIPYKEIREKTTNLIEKLKAVDISKKEDILSKYIINNEIAYCIGAEQNFFESLANQKRMLVYTTSYEKTYYPNIIKMQYNDGQNFYQISNYKWCNTELKTVVVDKYMRIIFHQPITLSVPIQIIDAQRKQSVKSSSSQPKPMLKR